MCCYCCNSYLYHLFDKLAVLLAKHGTFNFSIFIDGQYRRSFATEDARQSHFKLAESGLFNVIFQQDL